MTTDSRNDPSNTRNYRLEIVNASKTFASKPIVEDVSFHVDSGEIVGLLGPNGAGKTTCFNMLIGLERCDVGRVLINRRDVTSLPIYDRAKLGIGYLPQESSIFRRLSVEDNIKAVLQTNREMTAADQHSFLQHILNIFHINDIRYQLGTTLSGGERRRVEIARAIALQPRFMLLDEPFAGVDPIAVDDVISQVKTLSEWNVGVLITDHNVRETLRVCNRAYILNQGQVLASGSSQEVMRNPDVRNKFLGRRFRF